MNRLDNNDILYQLRNVINDIETVQDAPACHTNDELVNSAYRWCNFSKAEFIECSFDRTFIRAKFTNANLNGCKFHGTELNSGDFKNASFWGADFEGSTFKGATSIDLTGVNPKEITPPAGYELKKINK